MMKVLVAPLDWGLGHATRSIPIIRDFLRQNATVELAVSGSIAALYKTEFPDLKQIPISSYAIRYPKHGFEFPLWLLTHLHRIQKVVAEEHQTAERLVRERQYDVIFSDNRFGFYAKGVRNIYMTHQLRIAFPGVFRLFEKIGILWHCRQMQNFDEIWIPDEERFPGLAGRLSHVAYADENLKQKIRYVGPQSRFAEMENKATENAFQEFRFLALLSGPEPMRTAFEKKLLRAFSEIPGCHALVRGLPGSSDLPAVPPNVSVFNHLETPLLAETIRHAETVVSRSGYSTVMDMRILGASCIFVPTPGQTEQLYLGKTLLASGIAGLLFQNQISKDSLLEAAAVLKSHPKNGIVL